MARELHMLPNAPEPAPEGSARPFVAGLLPVSPRTDRGPPTSRTMARVTTPPRDWEIELPNGDYAVAIGHSDMTLLSSN